MVEEERRQGLIISPLRRSVPYHTLDLEEDTKNGEDDPKNTRSLFGLESSKTKETKDGSIVWGISGGVMAQCIPVAPSSFLVLASPVAYASTWTKKKIKNKKKTKKSHSNHS